MTDEPAAPTEEPAAAAEPTPEAKIAALEAEVARLKDEALRALAEAENTRRRAAKEAQDGRAYAIEKFARDLLPVADTLQRALAALGPDKRGGLDDAARTFVEGVEMTGRALADAFGRNGLREVGAAGEAFDPNRHQAVAQIPSAAPAGAVAEVLQPGYMLQDRTVRPAMVAVSAGPPASSPTPAPEDPPAGERVDVTV